MTFRVGQKVVCIHTFPQAEWTPEIAFPNKDAVYTIRAIIAYPAGEGALLREIKNPQVDTFAGFVEPAFTVRAFRPLVERKTDISIFKKMLAPSHRALEDASQP